MTTSILIRYMAIGLLIKIGSLAFLGHTDEYSSYVALAYAILLLCLLIVRPLKNHNSLP